MCAKAVVFLLFACQILLNEAYARPNKGVKVRGKRLSEIRSATLPAGYVRFPDVNAAYKVHKEGTTWNVARERCIAEGGRLAVTDSIQKVQHIKSLKSDGDYWIHVGIHKLTDDSEWVRADNGLPPSSIPWIRNNPDGSGNCAGISLGEVGLLDYSCNWGGEWYVCEIPI